MARVSFGETVFDADLVVFDKDGTLIDFEMWNRLAVVWVERLAASDEVLRQDLGRALGFDPDRQSSDPQGPLAIATTAQVMAICGGTLYRHGVPWPEAEERTQHAFDTEDSLPLLSLVRPAGDLVGLLERLRSAGLRLAVVTTDHRRETEATLQFLRIAHLVDHVVCGDDGLPAKPAPDMLLATCERLGVTPARTAVVGDTLGDMIMAARAGAGLCAGVLTGAGSRELLAAHGDVVLASVDDIHLTPGA